MKHPRDLRGCRPRPNRAVDLQAAEKKHPAVILTLVERLVFLSCPRDPLSRGLAWQVERFGRAQTHQPRSSSSCTWSIRRNADEAIGCFTSLRGRRVRAILWLTGNARSHLDSQDGGWRRSASTGREESTRATIARMTCSGSEGQASTRLASRGSVRVIC